MFYHHLHVLLFLKLYSAIFYSSDLGQGLSSVIPLQLTGRWWLNVDLWAKMNLNPGPISFFLPLGKVKSALQNGNCYAAEQTVLEFQWLKTKAYFSLTLHVQIKLAENVCLFLPPRISGWWESSSLAWSKVSQSNPWSPQLVTIRVKGSSQLNLLVHLTFAHSPLCNADHMTMSNFKSVGKYGPPCTPKERGTKHCPMVEIPPCLP